LGQQRFDEKNIRRRVYDALNVLMAMGIILKDKKDIQWKGLPSATLDDIQELKVNFFQCFFTWFSMYDPFFSRAYLHVKGATFFSCFSDFVSDSDESYGGTHLLCYLQGVLLWSFFSANLIDMFPLAVADVLHPSKSPVVCLRDMLRVQKASTTSLYVGFSMP
jgi:hypothetical protein